MGLAATIASAVTAAFQTVDDLKKTVTYRKITAGGYDAATDTFGDTVTDTILTDVVVTKPTERDYEWFPATDVATKKLIIRAAPLGFEPELKDKVVIDTIEYEVMRSVSVPGSSIYIVFVQRP